MSFGLRPTIIVVLVVVAACARSDDRDPPTAATGSGTWLRGTVDERFAVVAKQLRGFDVAMIEIGHRYVELFWAGQDGNWPYAAYQLEKIETAMAHGIERRPKRASSAATFAPLVGQVRGAVERGDGTAFGEAFTALTQACNACHVTEQVAFVQIDPPERRMSPVRAQQLAPSPGPHP